MLRNFRTYVLLLLLAGCASLGLVPPESFGDRLAYAEGTNTAIREASTDALNNREITSADMEHVIKINAEVKTILRAARLTMGTDLQTAEGKLLAATKLLTELQAYLRARGLKTTYLWSPTWNKPLLLSYSH